MNVKQLKSLLLFVGLCVSGNAYGQTGTVSKLDTASTNKWAKSGTGSYIIKPSNISQPSYHFHTRTNFNKPIMRISDLKPDSSYHVWIDKKAIKWTSDSTFILKRKP